MRAEAGTGPRPVVLLVYVNPAQTGVFVPPYGLERLAAALREAGAGVRWCLPFLERDPEAALARALEGGEGEGTPALVLLSLRNLDDGLVIRGELGPGAVETRGYLSAAGPLVARAVAAVGRERVVLGGGGLGAGGAALLGRLGLRWGIRGPAEDLVARGVKVLVGEGRLRWPEDPRVLDADAPPTGILAGPAGSAAATRSPFLPASAPPPRHPEALALAVRSGAYIPVQISAGCDRRCHFCVEASFLDRRVAWREPRAVAAEVQDLVDRGVTHVFLAGSELNMPSAAPALALLRALRPVVARAPALHLLAFLQPAPLDDVLLDALEAVGMDPAELPVELGHLSPRILRAGGGPANLGHIEALVDRLAARGHRRLLGSVLLGAHPLETWETVDEALSVARDLDARLPEGLSLAVAAGARVYPTSPLGRTVRSRWEELAPHLYTPDGGPPDPELLDPVVFCRPGPPRTLLRHVLQTQLRGGITTMNGEGPATEVEARVAALREQVLLRGVRGEDARGELAALLAALPAGDPRRAEVLAALG